MSKARDKANSTVSNFASTGIDDNADANAITIDSSENVMIGTTDTVPSNNGASGDAGVAISPDGVFRAARSGNVSLDINRMDSDGEIATFRKNGTTTGTIVTDAGDLTIGTGVCGLRFLDGSNAIIPRNTARSTSNGALDLGSSSTRFKDLYLSGGVYLGGVGSANHLDDYEEGTWTPIDSSGAGLTFSVVTASYVKIGKTCTVHAYINFPATSSAADVLIGGLPFTTVGYGAFAVNSNVNGAHIIQLQTGATNYRIKNQTNAGFTNAQFSGSFNVFSGTYIVA